MMFELLKEDFDESFLILNYSGTKYYSASSVWWVHVRNNPDISGLTKFFGCINSVLRDLLSPLKFFTELPLRILASTTDKLLQYCHEVSEELGHEDSASNYILHGMLYPVMGITFIAAKVFQGLSILCRLITSPWKTWKEADEVGTKTGVCARIASAVLITLTCIVAPIVLSLCISTVAAILVPTESVFSLGIFGKIGSLGVLGGCASFIANICTFGKACRSMRPECLITSASDLTEHVFVDEYDPILARTYTSSTSGIRPISDSPSDVTSSISTSSYLTAVSGSDLQDNRTEESKSFSRTSPRASLTGWFSAIRSPVRLARCSESSDEETPRTNPYYTKRK